MTEAGEEVSERKVGDKLHERKATRNYECHFYPFDPDEKMSGIH